MTGFRDHGDRVMSTSNLQQSPKGSNRKEKNDNADNAKETRTRNAFDMIMTSGKKSSRKRQHNRIVGSNTQTSRFVLCPVGCGKHVLPHEMNKHLDACLLRQVTKQQKHGELSSFSSLGKNKGKDSNKYELCTPSIAATPTRKKSSESISEINPSLKTAVKTDELVQEMFGEQDEFCGNAAVKKGMNNTVYQNDVFVHMMKRSAKVFSEQDTRSVSSPKFYQQMHLHENGKVSVTCYGTNGITVPQENLAWSATVQVRGKKDSAVPPIDLLVSSSIPSSASFIRSNPMEPGRIRLVRNHSRLSVPVLKSILQKGIRRRKPLPSVRVASELADKSLGDFLRRLPIIILEDSTLHPNFPFLVWLMVAVSKDYQPSLTLLKRVLGVVFETASCRWQDSLILHEQQRTHNKNESTFEVEEKRNALSLTSIQNKSFCSNKSEDNDQRNQTRTPVVLNGNELLVWSILMRCEYGGMAGDIRMLKGYAELWHDRFTASRSIPENVKIRLSPSIPTPSDCGTTQSRSPTSLGTVAGKKVNDITQYLKEWNQVPLFIHESAGKLSACRIDRLLVVEPITQPSESESVLSISTQAGANHFVGLCSLSKSDITIEGVDFHCSSVLDSAIFSDANLVRECFDRLADIDKEFLFGCSKNATDRHSLLEKKLKSYMWKFSSGVNFRLPLFTVLTQTHNYSRCEKEFYDKHIRRRVDAFRKKYIEERLNIR